MVDSSHLITFFISLGVIVYASFKSLNIDTNNSCDSLADNRYEVNSQENSNEEDENEYSFFINDHISSDTNRTKIQTIDALQALIIPVIASLSLLLMFFYFDSIQTAFVICTSGKFYFYIIQFKLILILGSIL